MISGIFLSDKIMTSLIRKDFLLAGDGKNIIDFMVENDDGKRKNMLKKDS